jgi:hypothetical protein
MGAVLEEAWPCLAAAVTLQHVEQHLDRRRERGATTRGGGRVAHYRHHERCIGRGWRKVDDCMRWGGREDG